MTRLLALMLVLALCGCEREAEESVYRPGGKYQSVLDARGKRVLIRDAKGVSLGKWRELDGALRVYGPNMTSLGEVGWTGASGSVERVRVEALGEEPIWLEKKDEAVWVLPERLRLERVKSGWAMFDGTSRRLGYVAEVEPGKFAIRDDYSSPPRAFSRSGEPDVKTPAGAVVVSSTPSIDAPMLLSFAIDGLDNLTRAALAVWLTHAWPPSAPEPAERSDTGSADAAEAK